MPSVNLDENEWQFLIHVLGTKLTWVEANPLLMKIGEQLRKSGNSKEVPAPQGQVESNVAH